MGWGVQGRVDVSRGPVPKCSWLYFLAQSLINQSCGDDEGGGGRVEDRLHWCFLHVADEEG